MSIYCVSGVYGNVSAWNNMLKMIDFDNDDRLVVLGNVIDRNPGGIKILQKIMTDSRMYMIWGENEYLMANAYGWLSEMVPKLATKLWYQQGGYVTDKEFQALPADEKLELKKFITGLNINYKATVNGTKFVLCHAVPRFLYKRLGITGKSELEFSVSDIDVIRMWENSCKDGSITVCGHTPTNLLYSGVVPMKVYHSGCVYDIDCGAGFGTHRGGRLACLRLDDMKVFYTDEFGNEEISRTKLPLSFLPVTPYRKRKTTYQYHWHDLVDIIHECDAADVATIYPTKMHAMKVGIIEWFIHEPDMLVGAPICNGMTPDEVVDWLNGLLADVKEIKSCERVYAGMVQRTNL